MPYSTKTKLKKRLNKHFDKLLHQYERETNTIWEKSINATFEELHEEVINMYDALIEDYYRYKTTSYYRHHVGIGTGTGENLYFGKQFNLKHGFVPQLSIGFSGKDMDGYKHNSTDEVLSLVMNGIRGVPDSGWWATWHGDYNGKYFSVGGVDIVAAFDLFKNNFSHISRYIFNEKLDKERRSGKYKFYYKSK